MATINSVLGKIGHDKLNPLGKMLSKDKYSKNMSFYSVVTKKKIEIPDGDIKYKNIKGRKFAVGTYVANGKEYEAYRVMGKSK